MKNKFYFVLCVLFSIVLNAQNAGDIDPTFLIGKSFTNSGDVLTLALQSDGKIIAGGEFSIYDKITANNIVRLNADGTVDTTFNTGTGFNSFVKSIAIQSDGKIVVVGLFNSYNGSPANYIIRLNANGTVDSSFQFGTGFDIFSQGSIAIQSDGKIVLCGGFSSYNGTAANGLIRLNTDGTVDPNFNPSTGINYGVDSIALQPDGKLLISGLGNSGYEIIRLNSSGSIDTSFNSGTGFNRTVYSIAVQSDNKIVVAGYFDFYNGVAVKGIIRLNTNGTVDSTFDSGTGFDFWVNSLAIQSDGKIVAGGYFDIYNGVVANNVVRLNSNGTLDATLNSGTGFNTFMNAVIVLSDGKIIVGGSATLYNKTSVSGLTKLNSNGTKDPTYNTKNSTFEVITANISSLAEQTDGKIIVGGGFNYYFSSPPSGIIRLNVDGTKDISFNTGTGIDGVVSSTIIQPNGKILVGGNFVSYNGTAVKNIIRLNADGTVDTTFKSGTGFDGIINTLSIQSDGKIIVGGDFGSYNGTPVNEVIRLNIDGSLDNTLTFPTTFFKVNSVVVQSNGKILIGGYSFGRYNSDGTVDPSFNTGTGFENAFHQPEIQSILIQYNEKILVRGAFTAYNNTLANKMIRINTDGTVDPTFSSASILFNTINSAIAQSNGKILIGGGGDGFTTEDNIVRLKEDGTIDTAISVGTGFDKGVNSLMVQSDGKIVVGGRFTSYNGTTSIGIIRLKGDSFMGVENFSKFDFSVYPNPAQFKIKIHSPNDLEIDKIVITDLTGKAILRQTQSEEIDIENLTAGIYIIQAFSGQNKWQSKFIKE